MSPEERRLLADLFERVGAAAGTPRDREAEDLIAQKLREQPYAAYFLAQAVIIQDQALQALTGRVHELEDEVQRLEAESSSARQQNTGFLGGLGSLFGGGQPSPATQNRDTYNTQREGRLYDDYARGNREPEPAPGPWGRAGATSPWAQPTSAAPGGFLHGALTTAAGVAGGVLMADAVRDLFSSHWGGTNANPLAGLGGAGNTPVQETVNNYFLNDDKSNDDKSGDDKSDDRVSNDRDDRGWGGSNGDDNDNNDDDFDVADYDDGDNDTFA